MGLPNRLKRLEDGPMRELEKMLKQGERRNEPEVKFTCRLCRVRNTKRSGEAMGYVAPEAEAGSNTMFVAVASCFPTCGNSPLSRGSRRPKDERPFTRTDRERSLAIFF